VFDWDGTAVPDRRADASLLRAQIEALSGFGLDLIIVSGTHLDNVDGQLRARPVGPGRLHLCLNRGSEVFAVGSSGACLIWRRQATTEEDAQLSAAATRTVARLAEHGLEAEIVSSRLNRRKVDLIPLPGWADPPKDRIGDLVSAVEDRLHAAGIASLRSVVEIAIGSAHDVGLVDPRVTSDAKHVEIGLTDKSDSARWAFRDLWRRGIGAGLVLIAGDEFGPLGGMPGSDSLMLVPEARDATVLSVGREPGGVPESVLWLPGGPNMFARVLEDQIRRRRRGALPSIDANHGWTLTVDGFDPEHERAHEALLNVGDGWFGTSGAPLDDHPAATPRVLAAGLYDGDGPATTLASGPLWDRSGIAFQDGDHLKRTLDMRTGVLMEERLGRRDSRRTLRFASLSRPGTVAMRAEGHTGVLPARSLLTEPLDGLLGQRESIGGRQLMRAKAGAGGIVAVACETRRQHGSLGSLDRLGAYIAQPDRPPAPGDAIRALEAAKTSGFDRLLVEQRGAWARRWEDADILIEGDDTLQQRVRLALFHLMASVGDTNEAAVGARGITGPAYRGHVFWDSEVFVLPFLAATHPASARAMLEYRVRRIAAAREAAAALGRRGARFPWESARTGFDVTPRSFIDRTGREVRILTGELEEHVTADIAWAARTYVAWTGDRDFAEGPGREILLETARYWASRIELDEAGRGHIKDVIGPDEYHEHVDDNAFTNIMARWNLRSAAGVAGHQSAEEPYWRKLAASLVDGYNRRTRLYEQFDGFSKLEPLVIRDLAPRRPVAADLLLGRERVAQAQILKQADVLMLHHMLPSVMPASSLEPNLNFYEPRTAHGSSLSPGIHAALFARAGRLEEALASLELVARLDIDDLTGTTAGGIHLAAMGSLWQALVQGFAGIRAGSDALRVDPRLPSSWTGLEIRLRYRTARVSVRLEPGLVQLESDEPVRLRLPGDRTARVVSGSARFRRSRSSWQEERP
jgi:trehalose/maltose hydrolase-like predicted phosphorylase